MCFNKRRLEKSFAMVICSVSVICQASNPFFGRCYATGVCCIRSTSSHCARKSAANHPIVGRITRLHGRQELFVSSCADRVCTDNHLVGQSEYIDLFPFHDQSTGQVYGAREAGAAFEEYQDKGTCRDGM